MADLIFTTASEIVQKQFIYRVYDAGVLKSIWAEDVLSDPKFKSTINGGVGELVVRLARTFDNFGEGADVKINNRVECWVTDEDATDSALLYAGYVSGYRPVIKGATEYVEVTLFGYSAELQRFLLQDADGNTSLTYNSYDPSDILRDVINKYIDRGGVLGFTADSIEDTGTVVSYTFNTVSVYEAIQKIIELCPNGWYFRIDSDNVIHLKAKSTTADHTFTLGLEVENLETFKRAEDLVNSIYFTGGGEPPLFKKYEDTASQSNYGLYEKKLIDQRVIIAATAQIMAQRLLDRDSDPEIRSSFTIIDNNGPTKRGYDIETVQVGETLKVANLKEDAKVLTLWDTAMWDEDVWDVTASSAAADIVQILSVAYAPDSIEISASSRLPQVAKRIEDINRNLQDSQTKDNPSAPS